MWFQAENNYHFPYRKDPRRFSNSYMQQNAFIRAPGPPANFEETNSQFCNNVFAHQLTVKQHVSAPFENTRFQNSQTMHRRMQRAPARMQRFNGPHNHTMQFDYSTHHQIMGLRHSQHNQMEFRHSPPNQMLCQPFGYLPSNSMPQFINATQQYQPQQENFSMYSCYNENTLNQATFGPRIQTNCDFQNGISFPNGMTFQNGMIFQNDMTFQNGMFFQNGISVQNETSLQGGHSNYNNFSTMEKHNQYEGISSCKFSKSPSHKRSRSRSSSIKGSLRSLSSYNKKRHRSRSSSLSGNEKYRSKGKLCRRNTRSRSRSSKRNMRSKSKSRSPKRKIRAMITSRSPKRKGRSKSKSRSPKRKVKSKSKSRSPEQKIRSKTICKAYSPLQSGTSSPTRDKSVYRDRRKNLPNEKKAFSASTFNFSEAKYKFYQKCNAIKQRKSRQKLIEKWRMNNCDSPTEMERRLEEISDMNADELLEEENKVWIRSAPDNGYYERDPKNLKQMRATVKLEQLWDTFRYELVERGNRVRQSQKLRAPEKPKLRQKLCKHKSQVCSSSENSGSESDETDDVNDMIEELRRKQSHPYRLHPELWHNEPGEMNDGPLCRCSAKAKRTGIRHGFYAGENQRFYCDPKTNNADRLYHYRITISPPTNFLTKTPTIINYDDHEFIFEGFSLISHYPIGKLPTCKVIRFNIEYIILYVEEPLPDNFCIEELDMFFTYLFKEILELVDFDLTSAEHPNSCSQFHFMPRFARELPENGRELLPMSEVLKYLLESNKPLIEDDFTGMIPYLSKVEWQNFADSVKGMVVTNPGKKPCSLRVDQLDRETDADFDKKKKEVKNIFNKTGLSNLVNIKEEVDSSSEQPVYLPGKDLNGIEEDKPYPEIVHFGIRPPQLSYAGNPEYQKAWRKYVKFRHLLANMPKPTQEDKEKLAAKENQLHSMRAHSKMKRDVTVVVSSKGFYLTGLMCDVVQHALLIPVLVCHLRFHKSLSVLENTIMYKFKNRFLLQLALTHPSYRENFGTNSDHARNSLTNCGIRQPKYGDRRIHYMNTRKRGINTLISIMSRFGKKSETESNIYHNERLEFLGDAVVEFVTSIHLFHIFRDLEEGGLATYRAALVQNQHLAVLAKKLNLDQYMLYAHGSDLCHDLELKHAMANCFEALMGALFLDGGVEAADKVFGTTLYGDDEDCLDVWVNYPPHPLQEQEPLGDRKWVPHIPLLQRLTEFEESTGIEFKNIRLLARAFTDRSVGFTNLTLGSNQRLEFLGDSVLQLISSEYLYKYFPEHHEGHLSLLRSSLVNNKTQSVVCDDLGMTKYSVYANPKVELKVKDKADLLEAFLGALYVDSGLEICRVFCDVCFFPRLQLFIMKQDWNDPKSKLQQCCLTLRTMDNREPDIPIYKVVECKGPTNTRIYTVAVYFRHKRLAKATGHSIQEAEMNAAEKAMELSSELFPQLDHQKRVIAKSLKAQEESPEKFSADVAKEEGNCLEGESIRSYLTL